MRLAAFAAVAACLVLSACATEPADESGLRPTIPTTGNESDARMRARIHTELAANYFEIGNVGVALEEIKEALRADANYGPAHNVAGLVYAQLKEDRLAEESFERALSINPSDPDAHHNYGMFLCQRKQEKEAIRHFMLAVRNPLYPTPDRSYVNAGICARRSGDMAGAAEYFQLALKIRPNQPQALYQMADLAYARGDYGETKRYLGRLTQVAPATAEALWLGVRVERRLGDRNSEASYALQLRNRFPNSREAGALRAGQYE
ncbi:MAG TPA: type IV pilus biogenesis/stability protein PilW [Burkholderiales bacterium]|nr:type IV pilus biogenesis/stability protein PilW [Burkholderiales bacterium]